MIADIAIVGFSLPALIFALLLRIGGKSWRYVIGIIACWLVICVVAAGLTYLISGGQYWR